MKQTHSKFFSALGKIVGFLIFLAVIFGLLDLIAFFIRKLWGL